MISVGTGTLGVRGEGPAFGDFGAFPSGLRALGYWVLHLGCRDLRLRGRVVSRTPSASQTQR